MEIWECPICGSSISIGLREECPPKCGECDIEMIRSISYHI